MSAAILKAIDAEHRDIVRGAQAIYDARMAPARAVLDAARNAWVEAQAVFTAAATRHEAELKANLGEARERRTALRQAVTGRRPVKLADLAKITHAPAGRAPISLAAVRVPGEARGA